MPPTSPEPEGSPPLAGLAPADLASAIEAPDVFAALDAALGRGASEVLLRQVLRALEAA